MSVENFCERMERLELREDRYALVRDCDVDAMVRVVRAAEVYANRPNDANQFKLVAELKTLDALSTEEGDES